MQNPADRVSDFERARLAIAKLDFGLPMDLVRSFERAAEISGRTLAVERVGIWLLDAKRTQITCVTCHELAASTFVAGRSIGLDATPAYTEALLSRRVIAADDAHLDPRTAELRDSYLVPLGIGAMMDAPIFRDGEVAGVVCLEHIGGPRVWAKRETDFAVSVAEMMSTMLQQAARLEAECELRKLEERAALSARMESLGRLAMGIAHDFGNVLTAIQLAAGSLKVEPLPPERVAVRANEITQMADRGTAIVAQLLEFGRPRASGSTACDAAQVLLEMSPLLHSLLSGAWELDVFGCNDALSIALDRAELEQIVLNLVANARDAMPGGGQVTVGLQRNASAGVLSVSDNGTGMDAAMVARAFEPFVTSKAPGAGTGLGLSIVYAIVKRAGATVEVQSTPNRGTTIRLEFPFAGLSQ